MQRALLARAGDIKSNQTEPLKNRLFVISLERFGLESSYTTRFEDVIEPNRLTLVSSFKTIYML